MSFGLLHPGSSTVDLDSLLRLADFIKDVDKVATAAKELRELITKYNESHEASLVAAKGLEEKQIEIKQAMNQEAGLRETNLSRTKVLNEQERQLAQSAQELAALRATFDKDSSQRSKSLDAREAELAARENAVAARESAVDRAEKVLATKRHDYEQMVIRVKAAMGS